MEQLSDTFLIRDGNKQFYCSSKEAEVFSKAGYQVFQLQIEPVTTENLISLNSPKTIESPSIDDVVQHEKNGVVYTQTPTTCSAVIKNPISKSTQIYGVPGRSSK